MIDDIKVKNSDLDESTINDYQEIASVYKLILTDITRSVRKFQKIYFTYKKNHTRLGDLIYLASKKTGSDNWKDYEIKSKNDIIDAKLSIAVDSKYIYPVITKKQVVKLANKEVKKKTTELKRGYAGLKKKLEKLTEEIKKYQALNNTLLYDIDTVRFLATRKEYDQ